VKAAGVVVGRVEAVRLDPKVYDAVVTLRIDRDYPVQQGTIAAINTSGLLGEVYIGADAGGDYRVAQDGDIASPDAVGGGHRKLISQFLFENSLREHNAGGGADQTSPKPPVQTAEGAKKMNRRGSLFRSLAVLLAGASLLFRGVRSRAEQDDRFRALEPGDVRRASAVDAPS